MTITLALGPTRNGQKIYYTLEGGKEPGEKIATGIYYAKPKKQLQKNRNKEALAIWGTKKSRLILEQQAIGTSHIPSHKFKANFLDYYKEYVNNIKRKDNRP